MQNAKSVEVSVSKSNLSNAANVSAIENISNNYEYVWMPDNIKGK